MALQILFLTALVFAPSCLSAHLPAVRQYRPPRDEKRILASRLLRDANSNKERSLRDVLGESTQKSGRSAERARRRTTQREATKEEKKEEPQEEKIVFRSVSQLFAWAINNTVRGKHNITGMSVEVHAKDSLIAEDKERRDLREAARQSGPRALPAGYTGSRPKRRRNVEKRASKYSEGTYEELNDATQSDFDVIKQSVHALDSGRQTPARQVNVLLLLEEMCHSIDNGHDLQISGGIQPVIKALSSNHDAVRASAAWALATCCQNNPVVQNASLELNAVPKLSFLAARDKSATVRAKALFALNTMLELEKARLAFEELPFAMDVLRRALVDRSDFRATRRALNLTELLVQKNLDAWKTQLEAWDIPVLVEGLMRSHPDIDVRESAARTIAALDGRSVS